MMAVRGDSCLTPEQELLLALCRAGVSSDLPPRALQLLASPLDWAEFDALARRHGMAALAAWNLRRFGAGVLPEERLREMQNRYLSVLRDDLRLSITLVRLLSGLRAHGIEAMTFKGPVTAVAFYGGLGRRGSVDLDILVRPSQVVAAHRALRDLGYVPQFDLEPRYLRRLVPARCEHQFRHERSETLLDLHWGLIAPGVSFEPAADDLWSRRTVVRLAEEDVPTLGLEHMLLYLCLHGAKHGWSSLRWLCDLAQLLRTKPEVDWEFVRSWASHPGRDRLVRVGLALAHRVLDAPVPYDALIRRRGDSTINALSARFARELFRAPVSTEGDRFDRAFARLIERPRDHARHLHDLLLAPTPLEWILVPLPTSLSFAYYAIRPLRLVARCGLGMLR
jgi:hypothetical protein